MIFRAKKTAKRSLMASAILVAASFSADGVSAAEPAVYKVVDSQGRVTYANTPLKGGVKIELEPLTVIPSSPSGYLQTGIRAPVPAAAPLIPVAQTPDVPTGPVAVVVSAPPIAPPLATPVAQRAPVAAAPVAEPAAPAPVLAPIASPLAANNIVGSFQNASMETISQARREELRPAQQEEQILQTEKLLAASKSELEKVQDRNDEMRALRVTHATPGEIAAGSHKPPMTPEIRQYIERHYERIRALQDEIATHENNLVALRAGNPAAQLTSTLARANPS